MSLTGTPISDHIPELIWENNPDTPITATALSKSADLVISYLDFKYNDANNPHHREGTILMADPSEPSPIKLVLKRGCVFSIINQVDEVTYPRGQYKIFDTGLDDLWITYDNKDNASSSVSGWGINKDWFIFLCDARINNSETGKNIAQIIVSQSSSYPQNTQIPETGDYYSEKDTRLIGGFRVNSLGVIISSSIWDIAGKYHTIKSKQYMILDEYANPNPVYRRLRIADLESAGIESTISGTLSVAGNTTINANLNVINQTSTDTLKILDKDDIAHIFSPAPSDSGIIIKPDSNPISGGSIFSVRSLDQSERLRVEHNGKISTTNNTLSINGINITNGLITPSNTNSLGIDANLYTTNLYSQGLYFHPKAQTGDSAKIYCEVSGDNTIIHHQIGTSSNDKIVFESWNGTTTTALLTLTNNNSQVNIPTITATTINTSTLTATGQVQAASFNSTSSREMKKDIVDYQDSALNLLNKVKIVKYKFINDDSNQEHIGFIAEDTPSELSTSTQDKMSVSDCIGVLIKAVQELQQQIQELKNEHL